MPPQRCIRWSGLAVAVAIGGVLAPAAMLLGRSSDEPATAVQKRTWISELPADVRNRHAHLVPDGQPCIGDRLLPAQLGLISGTYWLPTAPDTTQGPLREVWQCGSTPTFVYPAGSIAFEPGWGTVPDAQLRWSEMAKQWRRGGVGQALGRPAFLEQPADGYGGEICVIVGDILIRANGEPDTSLAELLDMVNDLDLDRPVIR